jgi:hypothetical protein
MSLLDPSLPLPLLPQIAVIETSTSDSKLSLTLARRQFFVGPEPELGH